MTTYLSRDTSPNCEEEAVEVSREGRGQHGERIVGPTSGDLTQEGEQEHVDDGEGGLDNLTLGLVTQP